MTSRSYQLEFLFCDTSLHKPMTAYMMSSSISLAQKRANIISDKKGHEGRKNKPTLMVEKFGTDLQDISRGGWHVYNIKFSFGCNWLESYKLGVLLMNNFRRHQNNIEKFQILCKPFTACHNQSAPCSWSPEQRSLCELARYVKCGAFPHMSSSWSPR